MKSMSSHFESGQTLGLFWQTQYSGNITGTISRFESKKSEASTVSSLEY